ncbi:alpha/beta hydrolase family esterase [Corynebacterium sp. S7]
MKVHRSSLVHDRRDRLYITITPDELPESPTLLLFLHGSMQSSNVARNFTGHTFEGLVDKHGLILCYPDGVNHHFNDARRDLTEDTRWMRIDDVDFLRQLIASLRDEYQVSRVIAAGYSNGGQMVTRLMHDAPGTVQGGALFAAPVPTKKNMLSTADGWIPTPIVMVHGTADPMVPYDGGQAGFEGNSRGDVRSAKDSLEYYAALNGSSELEELRPFENVIVDRYTEGAATELWTVEGMGHVVPSSKKLDSRVGPGTEHFTAGEVVEEFFEL